MNSLRFRILVSAVVIVALVLACELALVSTAAVFVGTAIVMAVLAQPKVGWVLAGAGAFLIQGAVVLFAGMLGAVLPLSYAQTITLALTLSAGIALLISARGPQHDDVPEHRWGWPQWAALAGPAYFSVVFAASKILPGGNRYAWVMNNDAVNNILMVRDLVHDGGIIIGVGGNPVPFTTSMLSLFLVGPRTDYAGHGNLHADVIGMQVFWLFTTVLLGLAAGLAAAEIVGRAGRPRGWAIAAAAVASLATTMWFIVGYPIEYGFLNAALGLMLLMLAVLLVQFMREHPAYVLGLLMLASVLIIATWTPTVLFLAAFLVALIIVERRHIFVRDARVVSTWALPALLAVLFVGLVTVPSFVRTSSLLSAAGGVEHLPLFLLWLMPAALVIVAILTFGVRSVQAWTYSAIGLTQLIAVGGLLFLNRALEDPWTYYPFKMLWFGSAFIALLIVPLGFVLVSRMRRPTVRLGLASGLVLALLLCLNWAIPTPSQFHRRDVSKILFAPQGPIFNDDVAREIFIDDSGQLVMYYESSVPIRDAAFNFWNMSNWANSLKPAVFDLRYAAYYPPTELAGLCKLADFAGTNIKVVTAIPDLAEQVQRTCPDGNFTIVQG